MNDDAIDLILSALAHPVRRRIVDLLFAEGGLSVGHVAERFEMSRIGVMKHLAVLERADLLISRKEGRTRFLYFNPIPLQRLYDRWTTQYASFWSGRLEDLKDRVESRAAKNDAKIDAKPVELRKPPTTSTASQPASPRKPKRKAI